MPKDTEQPLDDRLAQERQDYLDAEEAYRAVLNKVAQTKPLPKGYKANYAPESRGHERAATDPYVKENHPEMAGAARRLAKEEAEFLALDEPIASHAQNNCSIVSYTGEKFYEYVAMLEVIYLLASDDAFRKTFVERFQRSAVGNWLSAAGLYYAANYVLMAGDTATASDMIENANDLSAQAREKIAQTFKAVWEDVKENYRSCGVVKTIQKAGVDGAFFVGELAVGAGALKAVKIVARATRVDGVPAVTVEVQGFGSTDAAAQADISDIVESVDGKTFSQEALEAKYGTPEQNHFGGDAPEENRALPDQPAEEVLKKQKESERGRDRKKTGEIGEEYWLSQKEGRRSLQNRSGNGIDAIDDGDPIIIYEVKTSTTGDYRLRGDELLGGEEFTKDRLAQMANGKGRYKKLSQEDREYAEDLLNRIQSGAKVKYVKVKLKLDGDGKISKVGEEDWKKDQAGHDRWRQQKEEAKKRRKDRKAKEKENSKTEEATGPPAP